MAKREPIKAAAASNADLVQAASRAGRMGVTPVAAALRLDDAKLKRLVHSRPGCQQPVAVPTFVELLEFTRARLGNAAKLRVAKEAKADGQGRG